MKKKTLIGKVMMGFTITIASLITFFPIYLLAIVVSDYKPDDVYQLQIQNAENTDKNGNVEIGKPYDMTSYNVGFGAYNQDMAFFMDNPGMMYGVSKAQSHTSTQNAIDGVVRTINGTDNGAKAYNWDNWKGLDLKDPSMELQGTVPLVTSYKYDAKGKLIGTPTTPRNKSEISTYKEPEFVLFQEVDRSSTRSYYINEYDSIVNNLDNVYNSSFASNFLVPWVPLPLNDMHGQVDGGLLMLSQFSPSSATRYSLANITTFPMNLFELDRCYDESRYPVNDKDGKPTGKEMVIIDAHFSAYDDSGKVRQKQLQQIINVIKREQAKGNYLIVGGDWNKILPGTRGYEGNDVRKPDGGSYKTIEGDDAIAPFIWQEFDYNQGDPTSPKDGDYINTKDYDSSKSYKKGDKVSFKLDKENYVFEALNDVPKNNNPIAKDSKGKTSKNPNWKYSMQTWYNNSSLTKAIFDPSDYGMSFAVNAQAPSNRNGGVKYRGDKQKNFRGNIDGFLISDNIKLNTTTNFYNDFAYSDHNATGMNFQLTDNAWNLGGK